MTDETTTDLALAAEIRAAVARLNEAVAAASRRNLSVTVRMTTHQTAGGAELAIVEAEVCKRL
jgi:hypothetical protein